MNTTAVSMKVKDKSVVTVLPNKPLWVDPNFTKTFKVVWVPNKLKLIFFNITYADDAKYFCEVITVGRSAQTWIREIQLVVLDTIQTTDYSITASEDTIQTTDYSITASEDPRQTMVSSVTGSQSLIPTTESARKASEVGKLAAIIVIAIAVLLISSFAIGIAIARFLKWRKRRKSPTQTTDYSTRTSEDNHQRNERVDRVQDGTALEPLGADRINGNQSKGDIQGKEEETSV